ncbi:MAG TPA: CHAT domain-containing protein [Coleofasciculaceae cyanobacterium]
MASMILSIRVLKIALALLFMSLFLKEQALAQRVIPANDGTQTRVTRHGERFDITGGQRSRDGANLFHSLEELGLSRDQIANFQSDPEIRNILTRVVGGHASVIDGLLQVTGGHSNLFLINPAGIIFGANARLNVPASFTATTATNIGFNTGWFNAIGSTDYAALVGDPNRFAFTLSQPGSILNAGILSVAAGQRLALLGGTVVNTGEVSAAGGQIVIAAVPGENLVRLSQPGSLLSLEFEPIAPNGETGEPLTPWSFPVASLPELLTGGAGGNATGVIVQPDGTVQLAGSGLTIPTGAGTAIVSGRVDAANVDAANVDAVNVDATNVNAASPAAPAGGSIAVVGDRIGLVSATLDASGSRGGGSVRIGGDYRGQGTFPTATRTFVSQDSQIHADALTQGDGGRVITWANQLTAFLGNISARGGLAGGNGGFVEVSGQQTLAFEGQVDVGFSAGDWGTLLLDPRNIQISNAPSNPATVATSLPNILVGDFPNQDITISYTLLQGQPGNVILEATNNITIDASVPAPFAFSYVPGSTIRFTADADNDGVGSFIAAPGSYLSSNGRDLVISGASITVNRLTTFTGGVGRSGNLTLTAQQDIQAGELLTNDTTTFGAGAGNVTLTSNQGNISVQSINTSSGVGNGSNVVLTGDRIQLTGTIGAPGTPSIYTATLPGLQPGTVNIQQAGGPDNLPFTIGSPSNNGTVGAIDAGSGGTLANGSFVIAPNGATVTAAPGITLTSVNAAPQILSANTLFNTTSGQPATFTLADLAVNVSDANRDNTVLQILAIAPGGTLTQNGIPVAPGTVITAGDVFTYTPPAGASGTVNAFTLAAADLNNGEPVLAVSNRVPIRVNISSLPAPVPTPNPVPSPVPTPNPNPVPSPVPAPTPNPTPSPSPSPSPSPAPSPAPPTLPNDPRENLPSPPPLPTPESALPPSAIDTTIATLEQKLTSEYTSYLGLGNRPIAMLDEEQQLAREIEHATGAKPAFVYIDFVPEGVNSLTETPIRQDSDQLELLVVTANQVIRKRISQVNRAEVLAMATTFRTEITNPRNTQTTSYLPSAQQLYQWLIAPIAPDLQAQAINNLVFLPEAGLRSLPFAALHDGQQFLVEQYSIGLMPSLSLTDTRYVDIRNSQILAMGISESTEGQNPLPAVPIELSTLVLDLWQGGRIFLNNTATLENLQSIRQQQPFGIIHLATHADFVPGTMGNSYIQLWNEKLKLDQVRQLGWNNPSVEMLVLSACRTALGNEEAELGFAGLAVQTGVKTAVASLWYVSDVATAALISEFYGSLSHAPFKAQALQQAQIAMIRGQVYLEGNQLKGLVGVPSLPLPSASLTSGDRQLSHPYYWAAFTMVGNPW